MRSTVIMGAPSARRSGDEIHPRPPNGDLRPFLVIRDVVVQRPLRGRCGHSAPDPRYSQAMLRARAVTRLKPSRVPGNQLIFALKNAIGSDPKDCVIIKKIYAETAL